MPGEPRHWVLKNGISELGPAGREAVTTAFEHTCAAPDLVDRSGPLTDAIVKIIIERAKQGERDPVQLCEAVLEELRSHH